MNTYNSLINNLETLQLNSFRENIDKYLDMIAEGTKTALDAIYELSEMEIGFRKEVSLTNIYVTFRNSLDFSCFQSVLRKKCTE